MPTKEQLAVAHNNLCCEVQKMQVTLGRLAVAMQKLLEDYNERHTEKSGTSVEADSPEFEITENETDSKS